MMKIIIAPDSYKESLTAHQVARVIGLGFQQQYPDAEIILAPMADGGEGTLDCFLNNTDIVLHKAKVRGPLGVPIDARYGILNHNTAMIELAEASGLSLLPINKRDPFKTSTYGTGELIRIALDQGMRKFILALGGSATTDGGMGLLSALGFQFIDKHKKILEGSGQDLCQLTNIDASNCDPRLTECEFMLAHDVLNPLTGLNGAVVFAAQKGARKSQIKLLQVAYENYTNILNNFTYLNTTSKFKNVGSIPGTGAAGGVAAGLLALLPSRLILGSELVMDVISLKDKMKDANLVITGEGKVDSQTLQGKAPITVARLAKSLNIPTIAIVAEMGKGYHAVYEAGITAVFSITPGPISQETCLKHAQSLLLDTAINVARLCSDMIRL